MKKLLMILALSLPIMAQEAEAKESVGKKVVRTIQDVEWSKSKSAHKRDHKKNGDMKRGGMEQRNRRMAIAKRNKMHKKRAIRSFVRVVVIGGIAYYIGYLHGEKNQKGGWDKKPPMGDRK